MLQQYTLHQTLPKTVQQAQKIRHKQSNSNRSLLLILQIRVTKKTFKNTLRLTNQMLNKQQLNVKYIGSKYRIGKKIDEGAFGKIYKGINVDSNNEEYAIKMQSMKAEHPQLIAQCKLYHLLHGDIHAADHGIPRVYSCGAEDEYNYLVMDLMGPSLESLLGQHSRKFGLKTVLMLMDQMILRIEYLHSRNLIHRDIKPDNFCMGINGQKEKLFILDFGLAKKYVMPNGKHIPYKQGKSLTGTARYASINTHKGVEQACRDDMESIGYVAMYCLKGVLPWQDNKKLKSKADKYQRIKDMKINTPVEVLCKGFPDEFARYLQAVKRLGFEEKPNYQQLRNMFRELFYKIGFHYDYEYDWTKMKPITLDQSK